MRFWYRATRLGEHTHSLVGWLEYPHGQGFMAPTRENQVVGDTKQPGLHWHVTPLIAIYPLQCSHEHISGQFFRVSGVADTYCNVTGDALIIRF